MSPRDGNRKDESLPTTYSSAEKAPRVSQSFASDGQPASHSGLSPNAMLNGLDRLGAFGGKLLFFGLGKCEILLPI